MNENNKPMKQSNGNPILPIRGQFYSILRTAVLLLGIPCVLLITGIAYSITGIHGGNLGENILLATFYFLLLWAVFRLGRLQTLPKTGIVLVLILIWFGPFAIGHAIGYADLREFAYKTVREDGTGTFPADWKSLSKEALFPEWIGLWTGRPGDGIPDYFLAQAAIGWEGVQGLSIRTHSVRAGLWTWIAWCVQLVLFSFSGVFALLFAAKGTQTGPSGSGAKLDKTPNAGPRFEHVPNRSPGPADLQDRAEWMETLERENILVSYCYEMRSSFQTLQDFLRSRVRKRFEFLEEDLLASDMDRYLNRICVLKSMSHSELSCFLSKYARSVIAGRPPSAPDPFLSAILCRDEESVKQAVWETEKGYWEVFWSKN